MGKEKWNTEPDGPDIITLLEAGPPETLEIPEGIEVETVSIEGLQRTKNWVADVAAHHIMGSKTLKEMQDGILAAQNQLLGLGVFKRVDTFVSASKGDHAKLNGVDVVFDVDEDVSLTNIKTSAKIGDTEGQADVEFVLKNPLGLADKMTASGMMTSGDNTAFNLVYQIPVGGDADYPLQYGIFKTRNVMPQSSHAQLDRGAFARYQTYSLWGQHTLQYDAIWRNTIPSDGQVSFKVREEAGHSLKSALSHKVEIDMKDLSGDFGGMLKMENELAGFGGDAHFVKHSASYSHNVPLWGGCSFSLSARGGLIQPLVPGFLQSKLVPSTSGTVFDSLFTPPPGAMPIPPNQLSELRRPTLHDRFFLGGVNDVRGFRYHGIGPRDKGDALGGDAYWAFGANLYTPLPFKSWRERTNDNLLVHFFANAGACVDVKESSPALSGYGDLLASNTAVAVGLGLTAKMANIQLELNYCFPIKVGISDRPISGLQFGGGFSFL